MLDDAVRNLEYSATFLQVKYDSGVEAALGNELTPTQVRS